MGEDTDLPQASPSFPRLNHPLEAGSASSFLGLQDGWQHPDPSQVQTPGQGPKPLNPNLLLPLNRPINGDK